MNDIKTTASTGRRFGSFSLKSFLIVCGFIAAYFAGRASTQPLRMGDERPVGDWKMEMKAGYTRQVVIIAQANGEFKMSSGETVFNGTYRLEEDRLIMTPAETDHFSNFVWKWNGNGWVLIQDDKEQLYIGSTLLPWGYKQQSSD